MTQNLSPMQEAFEAWVVTQNVVKKYNASLTKSWNNQFYRDYRVNDRWMAWQAAFKLIQTNPCVLGGVQ